MPVIMISTRTLSAWTRSPVGMLAAILVRSENGRRWFGQNLAALRVILALLTMGVVLFSFFSYGSLDRRHANHRFHLDGHLLCRPALAGRAEPLRLAGWLFANAIVAGTRLGFLLHVFGASGRQCDAACVAASAFAANSTLGGVLVTVLAIFVAYGIAKLSWIYFEGPLQRRGHAFRY
jgi:hypothetical protein